MLSISPAESLLMKSRGIRDLFLTRRSAKLRLFERVILAARIDHLHAQAVFIPPQAAILLAIFSL
jgi:hypothetical protein